jgi:WD40 repeat protein
VFASQDHQAAVSAIAWHPSAEMLVTGSLDQTVRLWDLVNTRAAGSIGGALGLVTALAVSPDGEHIAVSDETEDGREPSVKLWKLGGEGLLGAMYGHEGRVTSLAFSPDGTCVLSGGLDGSARLWGVAQKECVLEVPGDEQGLLSVSFSPNNRVLLMIGAGSVRLWDAIDNEELYASADHAGEHAAIYYCSTEDVVIVSAIGSVARAQALAAGEEEDEEGAEGESDEGSEEDGADEGEDDGTGEGEEGGGGDGEEKS